MKTVSITRRSFFKAAAITGAMSALAASVSSPVGLAVAAPDAGSAGTKVVRTCCRGCGKMECGVLVTVRDGRAIKVTGDPSAFQSMGSCCTKSQSSMQACYHPDRLLYPMKRTNPKGEDDPGWQRITWDESMSLIAAKIPELIDKWTGMSLVTYCGTSRIWAMTPGGYSGLFGTSNSFGAWQICKGPRHFNSCMVSEFAWSWMETVARPRVYVQWAAPPRCPTTMTPAAPPSTAPTRPTATSWSIPA
ncbi:MAG: hypothetical protein IJJ14_06340 [Coriobacteriales bacterium]|nr:hypothetical protein [Coriobacteriales bacterium]